MIPNQWYAVLTAREVPHSRPVGVTRLGEKLVLWRDGAGGICCLRDRCVHRGVMLSTGRLKGGRVQCPFHGFEYDGTGRCTLIPANGSSMPVPENFQVVSYPAREAHGLIWLWWGEEPAEDLPPLPFFEEIDESFCHTTFSDHWNVHYTRAIENQLDVIHLPFTHHNTIGRGMGPVADGPITEWLDEERKRLRFYVTSRQDDGSPPKKPEELERSQARVYLDFHFPNLWQNVLGRKLRIFAAFTPIDEDNTMIYLRMYQKIIRIPLLRHLFQWIMTLFNRIILNQDKRAVITQQPRRTWLKMDEQLVQGDRPIVMFRARRKELLEQAGLAEKTE